MRDLSSRQPGTRQGSFSADVLLGALLTVTAFLLAWLSQNFIDIGLYDETSYLSWGISLPQAKLPEAGWAPIYAIWYFLLASMRPDPASLYFLNYAVLSALVTLLLYCFLRASRIGLVSAGIWSSIFLFSNANVMVWPKVSSLALACILAAATVCVLCNSALHRLSAALICAAVIAYLRPEFALSWILAAAFGLVMIAFAMARSKPPRPRELLIFVFSLAMGLGLVAFLGNPLQGSRSIMAFGQHFSLHYVKWYDLPVNPWTNYESILAKAFGDATSISGAFFANPVLFLRHVVANLWTIPGGLADLFSSSLLIAIKTNHESLRRLNLRWLPFLLPWLALLGLPSAMQRLRSTPSLRFAMIKVGAMMVSKMQPLIFLIAFVFPVPLITSILIFPRSHYLLLLFPLLVLALATLTDGLCDLVLPSRLPRWAAHWFWGCLLVAILLVAAESQTSAPRPNSRIISELKRLNLRPPLNILESYGGLNVYLGKGFDRVAEYDKKKEESCEAFLTRTKTGLIVGVRALFADTRFAGLPDCEAIKAQAFPPSADENGVAILKVAADGSLRRLSFLPLSALEKSGG
jgi:hypothetical protein